MDLSVYGKNTGGDSMIIDRSKESFNQGKFEAYLLDDGSLDTVIEINKKTIRINHYDATEYRSEDGSFTDSKFKELVNDYLDMFDYEHDNFEDY